MTQQPTKPDETPKDGDADPWAGVTADSTIPTADHLKDANASN